MCALRPIHHYHISTMQNPLYTCVYSAYVIMCLYECVCAYVCVSSQSPLFHKVYFYLLFKSDSTACISYLM